MGRRLFFTIEEEITEVMWWNNEIMEGEWVTWRILNRVYEKFLNYIKSGGRLGEMEKRGGDWVWLTKEKKYLHKKGRKREENKWWRC